MKINIIVEKNTLLPKYARPGDAGMDLKANIKRPVTLKPLERLLVPTGVKIALKEGYEAQIRPRSGNAINLGLSVLNTPGTVDENFFDEWKVILINLSNKDITILPEMKIAQAVFNKVETVELNPVDAFTEEEVKDDRGGGFGSTTNDKIEITEKPKKPRRTKKKDV